MFSALFFILIPLFGIVACGELGNSLLDNYSSDENRLKKYNVTRTVSDVLNIISWIIVITIYTNSLSLININDDLKQYVCGIVLILPLFTKYTFTFL